MFEQNSWYKKLPNEKLEVYQPNLELFFETMYERQMIWKRRFLDNQSAPWTKNKILRDFKFTNVYRELDKNSQWQIKNILLDEELSLKNLVWKMMFFRAFNNPETFSFEPKGLPVQKNLFGKEVELMSSSKWRNGIPSYEEYDECEFEEFVAGLRSVGKNPFTNAYLINSMAAPGKTRDYCYTRVVIPAFHSKINELIKTVVSAKTPEVIINYLTTLPSVSGFMAHEYYQDFTYITKYTDRRFMKFTQDDYTNVGPGASLGIRLIFPNLKKASEQKQAIYNLRDLAEDYLTWVGKHKGEPMPYLYWDKFYGKYIVSNKCNITLHQIEMWLCEFQKYWKMSIKEGKQRSKFQPSTNGLINK